MKKGNLAGSEKKRKGRRFQIRKMNISGGPPADLRWVGGDSIITAMINTGRLIISSYTIIHLSLQYDTLYLLTRVEVVQAAAPTARPFPYFTLSHVCIYQVVNRG